MNTPLIAGGASRAALSAAGDRVLLTDAAGHTRTGHTLGARTAQLAGELSRRKLSRQRVGLWYRNGLAAFESFLAVEWIGATRVVVDPEVPPAEARAIFDAAGVDVVIADEEHASALGQDALTHDRQTSHSAPAWTESVQVDPSTTLVVYPRSVSAGELFSVGMSYGNWDAMMRINSELYATGWYGQPWAGDECLLTMQQLMHGTGLVASFPFLLMGLPQIVMPKFDGEVALELIRRHSVTTTFGVPGMLSRLADAVGTDQRSLPLRHTLYGGAPLPVEELRRVRRILGGSLVQLYGRFEAGWPLAVLGQEEHQAILQGDDDLATSCGRPIPQIEIRLGEAPDTPTGYGELQTRNPMVSPDYVDPEGWCALGDVAHFDDGGYLHLAGRLDGMINTGSYHVYPQQVAEAVRSIEGVTDARVVGEADPVWGQAVTAYIVPEEPVAWEELVTRLRKELPTKIARYKVPKSFHRVEDLAAGE